MNPSFVFMPTFIYQIWNQNLVESFLQCNRCQREISLLKACLFTGVVWINFIEFCFESLARPPRNSTKVTPRERGKGMKMMKWSAITYPVRKQNFGASKTSAHSLPRVKVQSRFELLDLALFYIYWLEEGQNFKWRVNFNGQLIEFAVAWVETKVIIHKVRSKISLLEQLSILNECVLVYLKFISI